MAVTELWQIPRAEFALERLPDESLGALFRDWLAMYDRTITAYPTAEEIALFARPARKMLAHDGEPRYRDFARFLRVRLMGEAHGFDLHSAFLAWRNGRDFDLARVHRAIIERAVHVEHAPVPEQVLADYPELLGRRGQP